MIPSSSAKAPGLANTLGIIVVAMHGEIEVESALGRGTTTSSARSTTLQPPRRRLTEDLAGAPAV